MNSKQQLRKWVKEERKKLDIKLLSDNLVAKLQKLKEYQQAKNVMLYYPLRYEINLLPLLVDKSKKFYLPKIEGENLLCCPYTCEDELCESCFKTKEPTSKPIEKELIDLVIVPALAVDKTKCRLGYGGGYYDRFLTGINAIKVVCLSEKFVLESVCSEKHDVLVDIVITA